MTHKKNQLSKNPVDEHAAIREEIYGKVGRPVKYTTDKERWEAAKRYRVKAMKNKQAIALPRTFITFLHDIQSRLETEMGFRPNMTQALRVVFKKAGYEPPREGGE